MPAKQREGDNAEVCGCLALRSWGASRALRDISRQQKEEKETKPRSHTHTHTVNQQDLTEPTSKCCCCCCWCRAASLSRARASGRRVVTNSVLVHRRLGWSTARWLVRPGTVLADVDGNAADEEEPPLLLFAPSPRLSRSELRAAWVMEAARPPPARDTNGLLLLLLGGNPGDPGTPPDGPPPLLLPPAEVEGAGSKHCAAWAPRRPSSTEPTTVARARPIGRRLGNHGVRGLR